MEQFLKKYKIRAGIPILQLMLFLGMLSCSAPAAPETNSDISGTISSLYQYSTLGIEKLGVIQVRDEENGLDQKINITITAKTNIVSQDKRRSFEALQQGQTVKVWLKDRKSGLLQAQVTADYVAVD